MERSFLFKYYSIAFSTLPGIAGGLALELFKSREFRKTIVTQGDAAKQHIESIRMLYDNALLIQKIGRNVAKLSTEDNLVKEIVQTLNQRSDYHRCIIMLADHEKKYLQFKSGYGYDKETEALIQKTQFNLKNPHSKGVFVRAYHEQQPLLIEDIRQIIDIHSKKSQEFARQLGGKDLICVPIAYENQILGILSVDRTRSNRPLSQSDVSLLLGIASQLAVGIVNTRAYAQLQASEKKYRDLVENAHSIILRIDPVGRIIFFNRFAQKLFGYSESQVYGKTISEVLSPTSPGAQNWIELLAEATLPNSDIPMVEETSYTLENGRTIWIAWTYRPIFSAEGKLIEILCIGNDITQLKQTIEENAKLEIQLIRAQKMEALGTLAGGVAHDLNNVLAGVINYPELMLMRLPEDSPLRRYATSIQKSGERAAAIVQDLLTLARRNVVQVEVINLNTVITEYIDSPEFDRLRLNHPLAKVNTRLGPHISGILGSPVQLSKAVMNLVANAVEALEGKPGQVSILTELCQLDTSIDAYERIPPGSYVRLTVVDNGCGMAADDLRRIFEPFFSRKKMGRSGTGLGMAVVWGTIKDHGGLIDIHSSPGRGSRFDIYFPPTTKVEKKVEATPVEAYRGKGEKILVVDDEESQREIAHEILTDLGYVVKTVASGEAAIEVLEKEPTDLIVLDMIMATGLDGLDTYRQIVLKWPGQRAIIASGFSDNEKVQQAMKLGVGQYLKKPYNREGLRKAVRQELDRDDELASRAP
jgi:PAS domain S-box-containing protein